MDPIPEPMCVICGDTPIVTMSWNRQNWSATHRVARCPVFNRTVRYFCSLSGKNW